MLENLFESNNKQVIEISKIPVLEYHHFYHLINDMLQINGNVCRAYFGSLRGNKIMFICSIEDTILNLIQFFSYEIELKSANNKLASIARWRGELNEYEEKISQEFGIKFI